jgi:L-lactate dehydrogenase complex protein LldG
MLWYKKRELTVNNSARKHIFTKLYSAVGRPAPHVPEPATPAAETLTKREKVERLKRLMEAVQAQVHVVKAADWVDSLKEILRKRDLNSLLYAPETNIGQSLEKAWAAGSEGLPELTVYAGDIEDFKEKLFKIDAAITSTIGAIADTGAIIVWPTEKEPRLSSLVPPVHIAVVEADQIYGTFSEVMQRQNWKDKMPTNLLLISGPSKTADIEFTLAFGVHGPKELIVFVLES